MLRKRITKFKLRPQLRYNKAGDGKVGLVSTRSLKKAVTGPVVNSTAPANAAIAKDKAKLQGGKLKG